MTAEQDVRMPPDSQVTVELHDHAVRVTLAARLTSRPSEPLRVVFEVPRDLIGRLEPDPAAFCPLLDLVLSDPNEPHPAPPSRSDGAARPWKALAFDASPGAVACAERAVLDDPPLTHLVVIDEIEPASAPSWRASSAEVVADRLGLACVRVATDAPAALAPMMRGHAVDDAVAKTVGLLLPVFDWVQIPHTEVAEAATAVAADADLWRGVVACETALGPPGCGRCFECVRILTALAIRDVVPPVGLFERELSDDAIVECAKHRDLADAIDILAAIPKERVVLTNAWVQAVARRFESPDVARWSPDIVARVARAANRTGARLASTTKFGWQRGEVPLRLEAPARHGMIRSADDRHERRVWWAMIDCTDDGPGATRCAVQLTSSWGHGIVWGYGAEGALDETTRARTLRSVRVRVWWSERAGLDPARVLETIEQGCLPLQAMWPVVAAEVRAGLPERLRDLVLALPAGRVPRLEQTEIDERIRAATAELVAGTLERDLLAARSSHS